MPSLKLLPFHLLTGIVLAATITAAQAPVAAPDATIEISSSETRSSGPGPSANFTGGAQVEQLFAARSPSHMTGGIGPFQPCARSAWHAHLMSQVLYVTAGVGFVQQWGGPLRTMKTGDVVRIPAGIKHWHGVSYRSSVTHLAIQEVVDGKNVDWLEPVTDEQYHGATRKAP